jgi:hypothetical protein
MEKQNESTLIERERNPNYLAENVRAMGEVGLTDLYTELVKGIPEEPVKIDPNIIIQGVKNPMSICFIGFSTKCLLEAIKRKKKIVKYIVIIEPNLSVYKYLLATEDISHIIRDKEIDFITGITGKQLMTTLFKRFSQPIDANSVFSRTTIMEGMEYVIDPFYYNTDERKKQAQEIVNTVNEARHQLKLSMGCSDDQYTRMEMVIGNKEHMYKSYSLKPLEGQFSDNTAIVCGGGPSLENFIKFYNEKKSSLKWLQNAIIIAADAVLHKLSVNGIKPHIITRCERKLTSIFKGVTPEMTKDVHYAAYPWTPPEFFKMFEDKFYLLRHNGVCMFTEFKSHAFVDGGVSAGNAAMEIAMNLGCKNIILTGIDLAFIDGKSHTEGTQVEFNIEKSKDKWVKIKDNSGNDTTTIPVWLRCLNEYTMSIDKHKNLLNKSFNIFNTSEKGAPIEGTEFVKFDDIRIQVLNDVEDVLSKIKALRKAPDQTEIDAFEAKIGKTLIELKELKEQVTIAESLAEDAKKTTERELDKMFKRMMSDLGDKPYEFIRAIRSNTHNYEKLWGSVADAYDQNFLKKCYASQTFRVLVFDILQLDLYQYDNARNSLYNLLDNPDERHYEFYRLTKDFIIKVNWYLDKMIELFGG